MVPTMLSAAPNESGGRLRSEARRRQRRARLALGIGALVLVGGIVAVVQVATDEGPAPTKATAAQAAASAAASKPQPAIAKGGKLEGEAKRVVQRFVVATLGRTDLAAAWELATPAITGAVTRKQWLNGELPIPPFPVDRLITTGYDVVASSPKKVLLQILLVPKAETGLGAIRYDMTIERASTGASSPWRVSYFVPYAPPGIVQAG